MTSPRLAQAETLRAALADALTAAGMLKALATLDAGDVPSGSRHGVVVVSAPSLNFENSWTDAVATFEVHVIAGPAADYLAAWETIDLIIDALHKAQINIATGVPGAYQPHQGAPLPAYTLTLNPLD